MNPIGRSFHCLQLLLLVALLAVILSFTGCRGGDSGDGDPNLTANDEAVIVLHGLTTEDIEISVAELKEMKSKTVKEKASRYSGEAVEVKATGPLLNTILEPYGVKQTDFNVIRFRARDDYSIAVGKDVLESSDVILGYYNYGNLFSREDGPVRVVVPGQRAMYWVRKLERIDFESEDGAQVPEKLVFLESAVTKLDAAPYNADGADDTAVKAVDLVTTYASKQEPKNVYMLATDGMLKNETIENFEKCYIKLTGENAPKFTAPELPDGMKIMDLITIHYGTTAFLSMKSGMESMDLASVDDCTGIPFSAIIKKIGSMNSDTFLFTGLDGTTLKLSFDQLGSAVIYLEDNGEVAFAPGVSGVEVMKRLLSIEGGSLGEQ